GIHACPQRDQQGDDGHRRRGRHPGRLDQAQLTPGPEPVASVRGLTERPPGGKGGAMTEKGGAMTENRERWRHERERGPMNMKGRPQETAVSWHPARGHGPMSAFMGPWKRSMGQSIWPYEQRNPEACTQRS